MNKLLFIVLGFISFTCVAMEDVSIQDATDMVTTTTSGSVARYINK
jgi:hypothetical protein